MSFLEIYRKYREFILYAICGIPTEVICLVTYMLLVSFSVDVFISNVASWVAGISVSFGMNKWVVFRSESIKLTTLLREFGSYIGSRLFSGITCIILFDVFYSHGLKDPILGIDGGVAKAIVEAIEIAINFLITKFLIFDISKRLKKAEEKK